MPEAMITPLEMEQLEVESSRKKTDGGACFSSAAAAAGRFSHVAMAAIMLAAFALCSILMYAISRPLPTSHKVRDQPSESFPVWEDAGHGEAMDMFQAQNIKLSMQDLLGKLAPSFKESDRLVSTLKLCNAVDRREWQASNSSVDKPQKSYSQTSLSSWDAQERMSSSWSEDLFIPVTFGHLPIKCVPFATLQDAAAELGIFTSQLSRAFVTRDASYSGVKMLRSSMVQKSGMRHHLMKLKLAALHPIGADSALQALHYFEAQGFYAESVMKLLHHLAGGMTAAYASLRVAQEEARIINQTTPELTLDMLMHQYCTENPNGPLGNSHSEKCFEDTRMMYALYSFAFTIIDKVALAHDEVCRSETQVHLGNQSNCPDPAHIKAKCFSNEIEYCYSSKQDHSPELNQYTRCCCAEGAVHVQLTQLGMKKQRYATAACTASRLARSELTEI